jgi:hypothetical protein
MWEEQRDQEECRNGDRDREDEYIGPRGSLRRSGRKIDSKRVKIKENRFVTRQQGTVYQRPLLSFPLHCLV